MSKCSHKKLFVLKVYKNILHLWKYFPKFDDPLLTLTKVCYLLYRMFQK